jgi:hypothetical protein
MKIRTATLLVLALGLALSLTGCGPDTAAPAPTVDSSASSEHVAPNQANTLAPQPEETRPHDKKIHVIVEPDATTFAPMPAAAGDLVSMASTSRWAGVLDSAAYRIEVPAQWNGTLVMFAHGYRGEGPELTVSNPPLRRHLIQQGYAWAASSYSRNGHDVRTGIEDTNALALAFNSVAAANGRSLAAPEKRYIIGSSMGGAISAATVERETLATASNKVRYHAAMPMCAVLGSVGLFSIRSAALVSAQVIAGHADDAPMPPTAARVEAVKTTLFTSYPTTENPQAPIELTAAGERFADVYEQFTGGDRPLYEEALRTGGSIAAIFSNAPLDATLNGVLTRPIYDSTGFSYTFDDDAALSADLNSALQQVKGDPDANPLRSDGLRWLPVLNGEFDVPVISVHTIGDLQVPFRNQQNYRQIVEHSGNGSFLVQRAVRGIAHCDFTVAEWVDSFEALVAWERDGIKPADDDVMTPAVVADPAYGCAFTNNTLGPDDVARVAEIRLHLEQTAACPAQ